MEEKYIPTLDPDILGQRFQTLRKYYSRNAAASGRDISQTELAKKCGLNQNKIHQLEGGKGTLASFLVLTNFYISQGFNPLWILKADNEDQPLYSPQSQDDGIVEPLDRHERISFFQDKLTKQSDKKRLFFQTMQEAFDKLFQ